MASKAGDVPVSGDGSALASGAEGVPVYTAENALPRLGVEVSWRAMISRLWKL